MKSKSIFFYLLPLLYLPSIAHSQSSSDSLEKSEVNAQLQISLCTAEEQSFFTCVTGKKIASLCLNETQGNPTIQYRYGTNDKIELAYPDTQVKSVGKFKLSATPYPGGGENRIRFTIGKYSYFMYDITKTEADGSETYPIFMSGILVLKNTNNAALLLCDNEDASIAPEAYDVLPKEEYDYKVIIHVQ